MKPFKQYIVEKLKIDKSMLITPKELADSIYDVYDVTHITDTTDAGDLYIVYTYFEDKAGNLLFTMERAKEPHYAELYTIILPDNIYNSFETDELYDRHVGLYRCPHDLYEVIAKECWDPPRVFFIRGVTDWKENTNYSFKYMGTSRNYIDTKTDIYIKLTNGKV